MPSSVHPTRDSSLRIRVAPEEVTLRNWPLVDRPGAALAAIGLAVAASGLAGWAAGSALLGCAVAALLAVTLWRTWLPVSYTLNGTGITRRVFRWQRTIPWTAIQRHAVQGDGVLLIPDAEVSPLSPLRGLYLHWGRYQPEVLAHIEYYVQSWQSPARSPSTAVGRQ